MHTNTPPDDPRHVRELADHIAHLNESQINELRGILKDWEESAIEREEQAAHESQVPAATMLAAKGQDALREEAVERAAEAIARHAGPMHSRWSRLTPQQKGAYRDQARAALSAAGPSEQAKRIENARKVAIAKYGLDMVAALARAESSLGEALDLLEERPSAYSHRVRVEAFLSRHRPEDT